MEQLVVNLEAEGPAVDADAASPAAAKHLPKRRRFRVLVSAYACEPMLGSEPGVGWNLSRRLAREHDIWVITRADHRAAIEAELEARPLPNATFIYHKLPGETGTVWYRWPLIQLHYYLWQISLVFLARSLHRQVGFDVAHHVTYVRYWTPNTLVFLGVPFLFGPVGSGEAAPPGFIREFPWRARAAEHLRNLARAVAGFDPLVRRSLRKAAVVLATTRQTAEVVRSLGARDVRLMADGGISEAELTQLATYGPAAGPLRLLTVSRLLAWKGVYLGLRAFAAADIAGAQYWIIGDGPDRQRLGRLAASLGLGDRVRFFERLPRDHVLARMEECHALVHPSLHDAGGWVCIEAMAAGRPVLCLDWGGPGVQVTAETGWKIVPRTPDQVVREMAQIMREIAANPVMARTRGEQARRHVAARFTWRSRIASICALYDEVQPCRAK